MKLLMHTCCAPCSIHCIKTLRNEGIEPTLFWYNPNIHPFTEYRERKRTLEEYTKSIKADLIINDDYGLRKFIDGIYPDYSQRCGFCYRLRLGETARYANENGYDAFTSTLFVSIYQNHELLKQVCEELSAKYGVEFLYRDFRTGFKEGQAEARELGLYMQKYCGCIFSEEERYQKRRRKDI